MEIKYKIINQRKATTRNRYRNNHNTYFRGRACETYSIFKNPLGTFKVLLSSCVDR